MDPDNTPRSLQNKVQFDIRYYFCRRGGENIHSMTKETFELSFDVDTKIAFLKKKKDEMTKNHKECNSEVITGFMPQILDPLTGLPHKMCPIRSYELYISKSNPDLNSLWQQPLKKFPLDITAPWYSPKPVGHNPIEKFFTKLSNDCQLSQHYTNHCIRVSGTTNLTRSNFTPKQIMSVTGHKSIESLAIYQKVKSDEKLMMGMSLTYALLHPQEVARVRDVMATKIQGNNDTTPLPIAPAPKQVQQFQEVNTTPLALTAPPTPSTNQIEEAQVTSESKQIVPYDPNIKLYTGNEGSSKDDFDLMALIAEVQNDSDEDLVMAATQIEEEITSENAKKKVTTASVRKTSPTKQIIPTFTGCKFGNIGTINIHIHNKEASRLYAELLLSVCWHTEYM